MKVQKRACWMACGVVLLACTGQARADKDAIISKWSKSFTALTSLQVDSLIVGGSSDSKKPEFQSKGKLLWGEGKFRADSEYVDPLPEGYSHVTNTFDGRLYSFRIRNTNGTVDLTRTRTFHGPEGGLYNGTNPFTFLQMFVFDSGAVQTMEALRDSRTWESLSARVSSEKPASLDGRDGDMLSVRLSAEKDGHFEVFVDQASGAPLEWKRYDGEGTLSGSLKVTKYRDNGALQTPTVPLQLVFKTFDSDGEYLGGSTMDVDEASVQVNEALPETEFTLPTAGVDYFASDEDKPEGPQ